jgi:hypothetical protein
MLKYTYTSNLELDDSHSIVAEIENNDAKIIACVYKKTNAHYYFEIYPTDVEIVIDLDELQSIFNKIKGELVNYKF